MAAVGGWQPQRVDGCRGGSPARACVLQRLPVLEDLTPLHTIHTTTTAQVIGSKRTNTLCGTPDYLAPEIILNKVGQLGRGVVWCGAGSYLLAVSMDDMDRSSTHASCLVLARSAYLRAC